MSLQYEIRPLGPWLAPKTKPRRGAHVFKTTWSDTLGLLEYELGLLDARRVVLEVDVKDAQVRRDGMLRQGASVGSFPGVRLAFESKHGPLMYATDAHERQYSWSKLDGWQANVRAIALALGALRAVDRYGVTRRGEQYQGWTAIAASPAPMTVEQAVEFLAHWSGWGMAAVVLDPTAAWKAAAKRAHPDAGGDGDTFDRLTKAKDLLVEVADA